MAVFLKVPYGDESGDIRLEKVKAERIGDFYKISHVPFWATNIAVGDVVSAELEEGELCYIDHMEYSNNSTVHIVVFDNCDIGELSKTLNEFGCDVCKLHERPYLAVNVLEDVDYLKVSEFLGNQENAGLSSYKESCLSQMHRDRCS